MCIVTHEAITHLANVGILVEGESSIYFGRYATGDDLQDFASEFDELERADTHGEWEEIVRL